VGPPSNVGSWQLAAVGTSGAAISLQTSADLTGCGRIVALPMSSMLRGAMRFSASTRHTSKTALVQRCGSRLR